MFLMRLQMPSIFLMKYKFCRYGLTFLFALLAKSCLPSQLE